jgi:peptidyl-dipeptidase A
LPADFKADKTAFLLDDALARSIPFIFFASGTMTHWEADIYAHQLEQDDWKRSLVGIRERISRRRTA